MAQVCREVTLDQLTWEDFNEWLAQYTDFKIPKIPSPLFGRTNDPLREREEKIQFCILSAFLNIIDKYVIKPFGKLIDKIKSILASVKSEWDEFINFELPNLGIKFMDFIEDIVSGAEEKIKEAWDKLYEAIGKIEDKIKPLFLPDPIEIGARDPDYNVWQKIKASIKEGIATLFKKMGEWIDKLTDKITAALEAVALPAIEALEDFKKMVKKLPEVIEKGWSAFVDDLGADAEKAKQKIIEIKEKMKKIFGFEIDAKTPEIKTQNNFWKDFCSWLDNWWTNMCMIVHKKITEFIKKLKKALDDIKKKIDDAVDAAKTALQEALDAVAQGILSIIEDLSEMTNPKFKICVEVEEQHIDP